MNLDFTDGERAFREEVRAWLADHVPREDRPIERAGVRAYDLGWQRAQWEGGWAGISWPEELGGRGLSLTEQLIWYEEKGRYDLLDVDACFVGLSHAGPTLMARASEPQKAYHLPRILRGEVVWCQGFSEPDAGSDLASLRTRATIDGDELVISGQKIWTTNGDIADWQELLVRTNHDAPKHKGLTWVICDMHAPGIEVRPLESMEGESDFCEVFYDDVRVPLDNVVGDIDDGWSVAMSTLAFERGPAFTFSQVQLANVVEDLLGEARRRSSPTGGALIDDDELARRLAAARADVASLRAMTYAAVSRSRRLGSPGPEASMLKLFYADLAQRVSRLALDLVGQDGLEYRSRTSPGGWSGRYLASFAHSIVGGTSEIQRNIVGERVLGLPRA